MKTAIRTTAQATAVIIAFLLICTLLNFIISLVFMTEFATIQRSWLWVLEGVLYFSILVASAAENNN
jgi:hypothetical protein